MPRYFWQSLGTKDDDKLYVKVLLGHLSRFYYVHRMIRVSPTTRNTPGRVVIFFRLWKNIAKCQWCVLWRRHPVVRNIPRPLLHWLRYGRQSFIYIKWRKLDKISRSSSIHISWLYAIYTYNYSPDSTNTTPHLLFLSRKISRRRIKLVRTEIRSVHVEFAWQDLVEISAAHPRCSWAP